MQNLIIQPCLIKYKTTEVKSQILKYVLDIRKRMKQYKITYECKRKKNRNKYTLQVGNAAKLK